MADWFTDDGLWEELYPVIWTSARYEQAISQVEQLMQLLQFREHDVLDMCCGPGRHSLPMAALGYRVTGVDASPWLLKRAAERAANLGVDVEWEQGDSRSWVRPSSYDLALNLFTSFGYFRKPEDNLRMLRALHTSLRPGGVLVLDVVGKELLARDFRVTTSSELADGTVVLERHRIGPDWGRLYNRWTVIRDGRAQTYEFDHALYSGVELEDRLHAAGFEQVRLYGDLMGNAYDYDARRLIAVATKGGG